MQDTPYVVRTIEETCRCGPTHVPIVGFKSPAGPGIWCMGENKRSFQSRSGYVDTPESRRRDAWEVQCRCRCDANLPLPLMRPRNIACLPTARLFHVPTVACWGHACRTHCGVVGLSSGMIFGRGTMQATINRCCNTTSASCPDTFGLGSPWFNLVTRSNVCNEDVRSASTSDRARAVLHTTVGLHLRRRPRCIDKHIPLSRGCTCILLLGPWDCNLCDTRHAKHM